MRLLGLPEGWKRVLVTFILVDLSVLVEPILETNKSIAKSFSLDASASSLNAIPYTMLSFSSYSMLSTEYIDVLSFILNCCFDDLVHVDT